MKPPEKSHDMGISQATKPPYFCERFLSYIFRMNFELVFLGCGAKGFIPCPFFIL